MLVRKTESRPNSDGTPEKAPEFRLRVLVVDDELAVREGMRVWLTQRHLAVVTAADLRTAMDRILECPPDVILLDVRLGVEDGLELVERLKRAKLAIPCVVATAHAGPYDGFKAHQLGVVSLIEKPSSPDEIVATLQRAFLYTMNHEGVWQPPLEVDRPSDARSRFVAAAVRLVDEDFKAKGHTLAGLARRVNISPRHLSKVFRREMGCSVAGYLHRHRVAHAAHLLRTTALSVKAIAHDCGYHGAAELNRHFRRRFRQSPLAYRLRETPKSST